MLQRSAARVECEGGVIIQKTAEGSHVDIRETTQSSREIRWVVTCSEDAAKLRVEEVLHHHPATHQPGQFDLFIETNKLYTTEFKIPSVKCN